MKIANVPGLLIRQARPEDCLLILTLIRELAEYERLASQVTASEEEIRKAVFEEPGRVEVWIAELNGSPAGFAIFFHNFSSFLGRPGLYLEDLFVRPDVRGRGVGKALLRRLARIAVERGCGRMEWAVLDWNEPAIRFYESLGAVGMRDWTVYRLTGEALRKLATDEEPE
ncbi:MAG TPA: GNAT family N-acetyltransferase [Acidobacteriota bacterium]|nr:GNAT family N-acetyltransferase [Acidobacteriota bacterium]